VIGTYTPALVSKKLFFHSGTLFAPDAESVPGQELVEPAEGVGGGGIQHQPVVLRDGGGHADQSRAVWQR